MQSGSRLKSPPVWSKDFAFILITRVLSVSSGRSFVLALFPNRNTALPGPWPGKNNHLDGFKAVFRIIAAIFKSKVLTVEPYSASRDAGIFHTRDLINYNAAPLFLPSLSVTPSSDIILPAPVAFVFLKY